MEDGGKGVFDRDVLARADGTNSPRSERQRRRRFVLHSTNVDPLVRDEHPNGKAVRSRKSLVFCALPMGL